LDDAQFVFVLSTLFVSKCQDLVDQIFLFVRSNLFSYFSQWKGEFQFCFTDQATISQSKDFFVVSRVAFKKKQNYFPIDGTHRSAFIYKSLFNNFFFDFYWIAHWFKSGYPTLKQLADIIKTLQIIEVYNGHLKLKKKFVCQSRVETIINGCVGNVFWLPIRQSKFFGTIEFWSRSTVKS
jgi:hypothetical protein